ncbi:MAG: hypothetical protein R2880_21195 [Deinococcales bacterium]
MMGAVILEIPYQEMMLQTPHESLLQGINAKLTIHLYTVACDDQKVLPHTIYRIYKIKKNERKFWLMRNNQSYLRGETHDGGLMGWGRKSPDGLSFK